MYDESDWREQLSGWIRHNRGLEMILAGRMCPLCGDKRWSRLREGAQDRCERCWGKFGLDGLERSLRIIWGYCAGVSSLGLTQMARCSRQTVHRKIRELRPLAATLTPWNHLPSRRTGDLKNPQIFYLDWRSLSDLADGPFATGTKGHIVLAWSVTSGVRLAYAKGGHRSLLDQLHAWGIRTRIDAVLARRRVLRSMDYLDWPSTFDDTPTTRYDDNRYNEYFIDQERRADRVWTQVIDQLSGVIRVREDYLVSHLTDVEFTMSLPFPERFEKLLTSWLKSGLENRKQATLHRAVLSMIGTPTG